MKKDDTFVYKFHVEIDGIDHGKFEKCEGFEAITDVFEYEEGGSNLSRKFIGQTRWPNIILTNGINVNNELYKWFKSHALENKKLEKRTGSIVLYNLAGQEVKRWNFFRAFPVKWKALTLEANYSGYAVETLEFTHEELVLDVDNPDPPDSSSTHQYSTNSPEATNEFIFRRTMKSVTYHDRGMPNSRSLWVPVREDISSVTYSRQSFNSRDEAFTAAEQAAKEQKQMLGRRATISDTRNTITVELHTGDAFIRGGPPGHREQRFIRVLYEIIRQ